MGNPIESIIFQVSCYVKFCFSDLYCLIIQLEHYNLISFLSCFGFWDAQRCLFWNWSFIYWSVVSHNIMFLMYDECAGVSYILLSFFVLYLGVYLYLLYLLTDVWQHSFFKTSIFLEQFQVYNKIERKAQRFSHISPAWVCASVCSRMHTHTHSSIASSITDHSPEGYIVTKDEWTLTSS